LTATFGDQANIAYVGFTRAIRELHLPQDFKTILTPEWQEMIERYVPVKFSRTSKSPLTRRRALHQGLTYRRYGKFTIEADLPKPNRKKPFEVGDRVQTRHGKGTIKEIVRGKYFVGLDGQFAQLREEKWRLKNA